MKTATARLLCTLLAVLLAAPAAADIVLVPEDINWTTDAGIVTFQLRFRNPEPVTSDIVTGAIYAQEYGAFLPDLGLIDEFDIPPIPPDSFFDVFAEIPFGALPPPPEEHHPWDTLKAQSYCPPDDHWDGNVDVLWTGPGGSGQTQSHVGALLVCPGYGASEIHVVTMCAANVTYTITGGCTGFNIALLNEDHTPAPAALPPGWTGWISVTADATVPFNTMCCFSVNFTCGMSTVPVRLCVTTCDCGPIEGEVMDWGQIKLLFD